MMLLIFSALATILVMWSFNRWRCRAFVKLAHTVPSNRWQTLLGFGKVLSTKDLLNTFYDYGKKYGPNSVCWVGPYPLFLTSDPDTVRDILTSKNCIDKPQEFLSGFISAAGQGLVTENEPAWSQHRKLLNKAFSNKTLISFLPDLNTDVDNFIVELETSLAKGEDLDMMLALRAINLTNATKTNLKRNLDKTQFNSKSLALHFKQILKYVSDLTLHRLSKLNWIYNIVPSNTYKNGREGIQVFLNLFYESLSVARKNDSNDKSFYARDNTVLDSLFNVSEQNRVSDKELQGLLLQFYVAAFETSSSAVYFALCLLAMHPEYQERLYEEVNRTAMNGNGSELTADQLDELTYLDMIFNETLRTLPVVPMVYRKVSNEDFTLSNGVNLPVGQYIAIDILRLHRSEELWGPQAKVFNPDHFLPANVAGRHPYAFIPFTKGQRFCIGWRHATLFFKIALAKLIRTFEFSTDFEFKNLKFENQITMKLVEEPRLKLERRKIKV